MTLAIDLRPDHRTIVEDILREHLPDGVQVWVFGSRAEWTTKDSSDLDLALEGDGPLDTRTVTALELAFEESLLPFNVDVVDLLRIDDRFRQAVDRSRVVLMEGRTIDRHAVSSDVGQHELELRCVAQIVMGQSPPGSTYNEHRIGLPFFQGVKDFTYRNPVPRVFCSAPTRVARKGDILLSVRAPIGRVNVADRECAIGRGLSIIRAKKSSDARYLEFVLRNLERSWRAVEGSGSVFGNATRRDLETLRVPWRAGLERRAIANVLGGLDDRIELSRRMNETLEAMARALFTSWFEDFDPVRAKMEGCDTGLPPDVADLFPDRLVESELGDIPAGWAPVPVAEVIDINPRRALPRGVVAPYLGMAGMPTRGHVPHETRMRTSASGARFRNGDTLLARITPCLENGKTAFVNWLRDEEVGWGSTEFIVLCPRGPVPKEFAYCLARAPAFREHAIKSMTGTSGRQRVPTAALAEFVVPRATPSIYAAFGDVVGSILASATESGRNSKVAASFRDELLPRLVSGEMQLPASVVDRYARSDARAAS